MHHWANFLNVALIIVLLQVLPAYTVSFNPGVCNNGTRGKFSIIKDRTGNDKIVACIKNEETFKWSMMNGNSYGNYIDPAMNCTDVVDNIPGAQNGMYFIKSEKGTKQVWCDVNTDGGGFVLVGVKDTPVSWAIPSSHAFIQPNGKSQWSSSLGDQPVLDFRIQISSSSNMKDTKAHWMYRFNSPRKLSKLLVKGEGGCSKHHPGIGDVAYVKDLRNNQIVSKTFQCSRFGSHIVNGLGWDKMNSCFEKVCGKGYAHINGFRYDSSGSFSYSIVSPKSGIRHNSTAFIGCDQGKCCACFGPASDKDYCAPACRAINGGTVLKKKDGIRAWFWIRSSLPKRLNRVWKKCMEYEKVGSGGKPELWHVNGDGLYAKGPCAFSGEVRLNDGVAVVSDDRRMNRLPNVDGLLSYRIDNGKLYLRGKSHWKKISTMKEVQRNRKEISSNQNKVHYNTNKISYNQNLINSNKKSIDDIVAKVNTIANQVSKLIRGARKLVYIRSECWNDPGARGSYGLATITVDGKDYSKRGRGYNVVVMNGDSGFVESTRYFDTYYGSRAVNNLKWFLNSIQKRRIVLIAIQDEGARKMTNSAYDAIRRIGALNQYKHEYWSSFALIGWSGPGNSNIVTQVQNHRYKGPSIIHKSIFVPV